MTADAGRTTAEAEIRALIEEQVKAIRAKDVNGSISSYAPDVLLFDGVNPLRSRDRTPSESGWRNGSLRFKARSATRFATSSLPRAMMWPSATP